MGTQAQARRLLEVRPHGRVHAAGIGGVGMAGLAVLLRARGFRVTGCDLRENRLTAALRAEGVEIHIGHDPRHTDHTDWLICSAALPDDHPERKAARVRGIPMSARGDVLAALSEGPHTIAVGGSHGKTTTAAMLAHILEAAGKEPAFAVGGELPGFGGAVGRPGNGPFLVVEADESDGTLRGYRPGIGVVTNIDYDHMEHFRNASAFFDVFEAFADQSGTLWYGADNPGAERLGRTRPGACSFGVAENACLTAHSIRETPEGQEFIVRLGNQGLGTIRLPLRGRHNISNALAAIGPAHQSGCTFGAIQEGLAGFRPPRRRFERLFDRGEVRLISDYAHHPAEIRALLDMTRSFRPERIRAVFQPHRYSRTRALGADFPPAFDGIDELLLVPVYAASEVPVAGGTAEDLLRRFPSKAPVRLCDSPEAAWESLLAETRPGDWLLLIGAGDIERIAPHAVRDLSERFESGRS